MNNSKCFIKINVNLIYSPSFSNLFYNIIFFNINKNKYLFYKVRNITLTKKYKIQKNIKINLKKTENINTNTLPSNKSFHLNKKNITIDNIFKFIENDKLLLLYTLCKLSKNKDRLNENENLNNLFIKIIEEIIKKKNILNKKEKLLFLCCIDNKQYADKIDLSGNTNDISNDIEKNLKNKTFKNNLNNNENINIHIIKEKNLFYYFCTILKNRKHYLDNNEITNDIFFFFQHNIHKYINDISLYLFNMSYLNRKIEMNVNILIYFALYLLKYMKKKIKKRMSIINLCNYIELITSIIHVSKLKINNLNYDSLNNIELSNKIKFLNKNEYKYELTELLSKNVFLCNDNMYKTNNNNNFYHYYNIKDYIIKKENDFNYNKIDKNNENEKENENINCKNDTKKNLNDHIICSIYFINTILDISIKNTLKKLQKNLKHNNFIENFIKKISIIVNYIFECLHFNIFSNIIFLNFQKLILLFNKLCINKNLNINDNKIKCFKFFSPSITIQFLHLLSIQNNLIKISEENDVYILLENSLNYLFNDDIYKGLSKRDLILLYLSISKLLFSTKKKYLQLLNNHLTNHFINFTYRDLYMLVFSLKSSEYCDLNFIEILLRHIYRLKHKFSDIQIFTIINIFHQFKIKLSIFNLLISYLEKEELRNIKFDENIENKFKEETNEYKQLNEDLENKEKILRELSSHIKIKENDDFHFDESDLIKINSNNISNNENNIKSILMNDQEIKRYLRKKKKNKIKIKNYLFYFYL